MHNTDWTYRGAEIKEIEDMPDNTYGFVYTVTHLPTGKKYIGKKVLYFQRNKIIGKRELQELKQERKLKGIGGRTPLKKKVITESDWKTYYGSQKEILELVKQGRPEEFIREVIQFVPDKKMLTYYECKHLFINEVLEEGDSYLNDNILGKFFRKDFFND